MNRFNLLLPFLWAAAFSYASYSLTVFELTFKTNLLTEGVFGYILLAVILGCAVGFFRSMQALLHDSQVLSNQELRGGEN